jgi:hypothetical protein
MKLRFLTLFVILAFGVSVSAKPKAGQVQVRKSQARKPQARKSQIHKPQPTISSRLGRYRCIYDFDRIIGGSDADTVYLLELKPNGNRCRRGLENSAVSNESKPTSGVFKRHLLHRLVFR